MENGQNTKMQFWHPLTVNYTNTFYCPVPDRESAFVYIGLLDELSVLFAFSKVRRKDVRAFDAANVTYRLFVYEENFPVAFLLFKFPPPIGDVDLPFNITNEIPPLRLRYLQKIRTEIFFRMIDTETGDVEGENVRTLDPRFAAALHETALEQIRHTKHAYSYEIELQCALADYPTFDDMWNNSIHY